MMAEAAQFTEVRMRAIISEMMQSQMNSFIESYRPQQNFDVSLCSLRFGFERFSWFNV
jgi:hypothetical protein